MCVCLYVYMCLQINMLMCYTASSFFLIVLKFKKYYLRIKIVLGVSKTILSNVNHVLSTWFVEPSVVNIFEQVPLLISINFMNCCIQNHYLRKVDTS